MDRFLAIKEESITTSNLFQILAHANINIFANIWEIVFRLYMSYWVMCSRKISLCPSRFKDLVTVFQERFSGLT